MSGEINQYLMLAKTLVSTPKSGSGFCIEGGFVLTTADVLEGMQNPFVTTRNGTRIKAMIVGMDIELNIGILRVPEESGLPALRFGDSTSVQPGHFALCIGNQNGLINSLSPLNVSGIRDEGTYSGVHVYPSLIQVAGTVGAGSSGSPLLNMRGEVIGMMAAVPGPDATEMRLTTPPVPPAPPKGDTPRRRDTRPDGDPTARSGTNSRIAIIKTNVQIPESARPFLPQEFPGTTGSAGDVQAQANVITIRSSFSSAGFAIPMNEMKATIDVLKTGKPMVRGWLGVNVDDDEKVVRSGQMVKIEPRVRIVGVIPDSPAAAAGLKTGDSLVVLNGTPIHCTACVRAATIRARVGDTIQAVVERGGKTLEIPMKIEAKPNNVKLGVIKP
jgi:S1-C subfamily serine protease